MGNIRLSYSLDPSVNVLKIIEENHYYPFGLKHSGYNAELVMYSRNNSGSLKIVPVPPFLTPSFNYKYNGKELQEELGLNVYDYGNRLYDPARAGWSTIDPLVEKTRRFSPYNYCFNNPLRFTDPDGMMPIDNWIEHLDSNGKKTIAYDPDVKTKAEAEVKGYKGVTNVTETATYHNSDYSEVVNLAADGKYNVNDGTIMDIYDSSYTSQGDEYIYIK